MTRIENNPNFQLKKYLKGAFQFLCFMLFLGAMLGIVTYILDVGFRKLEMNFAILIFGFMFIAFIIWFIIFLLMMIKYLYDRFSLKKNKEKAFVDACTSSIREYHEFDEYIDNYRDD